jgi:cytochrome c peroxidase
MKKITTVGFLFALLLAVALGVHHLAFAQSEASTNSPLLPFFVKTKTPATIPQSVTLPDPTGRIRSYQPGGPTTTSKNPFFSSTLGINGRSCLTCHQPQNGWSISPSAVQSIYQSTYGLDALFQPVDGSNCPDLGAAASSFGPGFVAARSQLFTKANIRIDLPIPPNPEWVQLWVENDPYGCEQSVIYGVPAGFLNMYRRPLPSANVFFVQPAGSVVPRCEQIVTFPFPPFCIPTISSFTSPEGTGSALFWDSRAPDLAFIFPDAVHRHGQGTPAQIAALTSGPPPTDVDQAVSFQQGIFTGQSFDSHAGDLTGHDGSGANGGPELLGSLSCSDIDNCLPFGPTFLLGFGALNQPQWTLYPPTFSLGTANQKKAQRDSIVRGEKMFNGGLRFFVRGVAGFNDAPGVGDPFNSSCNTCHNMQNIGNNFSLTPKHTGIGDNSFYSPDQAPAGQLPPLPPTPDLPLFGFLCPQGSIPFFSNPVTINGTTYDRFETTDPGTGLITGKCADLGKFKVPILRGLASRAPFFHGGNASSLQDVVNFYDQRFSIGLTPQQKTDLVNFLNTL